MTILNLYGTIVNPSDALLDSWIAQPRKLQSIISLNANYITALDTSIAHSIVLLKGDLNGQTKRDDERAHMKMLQKVRLECIVVQTQLKRTLKRIHKDVVFKDQRDIL